MESLTDNRRPYNHDGLSSSSHQDSAQQLHSRQHSTPVCSPDTVMDKKPSGDLYEHGCKRWTEHHFVSEQPFILSRIRSGLWCPRLLVGPRDPLSSAFLGGRMFSLESACQIIQAKRLEGTVEIPEEREFLTWFKRIQIDLPRTRTLRDPWIYPGP